MKGSGTGQPISFRCAVAAREFHRRSTEHVVELTGRTKKRRGPPGQRMTNVSREYRCACGHVGWSAHVDLSRLAP